MTITFGANTSTRVVALSLNWPYTRSEVGRIFVLLPRDTAVTVPDINDVIFSGQLADSAQVGVTDVTVVAANDPLITPAVVIPIPPPQTMVVSETGGLYFIGNTTQEYVLDRVLTVSATSRPNGVFPLEEATVVNHVVILYERRQDGLGTQSPFAVNTNIFSPAINWTYPVSTADGTDRFFPSASIDGAIGLPMRSVPPRVPDYGFVRRRLGIPTPGTPSEYIRFNYDMGGTVKLAGIEWALVTDGTYPTVTVHGSNDPAFFKEQLVKVDEGPVAGTMYGRSHVPAPTAGALLFHAVWKTLSSNWSENDILNAMSDSFWSLFDTAQSFRINPLSLTLSSTDQSVPFVNLVLPTTIVPYRYYCCVISTTSNYTPRPAVLEIQEFCPLVAKAIASPIPSPRVYTAALLNQNEEILSVQLSHPITRRIGDIGYLEIWSRFQKYVPYDRGFQWAPQGAAILNCLDQHQQVLVTLNTSLRAVRSGVSSDRGVAAAVCHRR